MKRLFRAIILLFVVLLGTWILYLFIGELRCFFGTKWRLPFENPRIHRCYKYYGDEGVKCISGGQCESGVCLAPTESAVGTEVEGTCVGFGPLSGCHKYVKNGKVILGLCYSL